MCTEMYNIRNHFERIFQQHIHRRSGWQSIRQTDTVPSNTTLSITQAMQTNMNSQPIQQHQNNLRPRESHVLAIFCPGHLFVSCNSDFLFFFHLMFVSIFCFALTKCTSTTIGSMHLCSKLHIPVQKRGRGTHQGILRCSRQKVIHSKRCVTMRNGILRFRHVQRSRRDLSKLEQIQYVVSRITR